MPLATWRDTPSTPLDPHHGASYLWRLAPVACVGNGVDGWRVRRGKPSRHSETIWEQRVSPETPTLLPLRRSQASQGPLSERLPSHRQSLAPIPVDGGGVRSSSVVEACLLAALAPPSP